MVLGSVLVMFLAQVPAPVPSAPAWSDRYAKWERMVPMRDGTSLFTAIYLPKSSLLQDSTAETHPILMRRTPYSCGPYGEDKFPDSLGPSAGFPLRDYIVVHQDVRGCWRSEGEFVDMRPQRAPDPVVLGDEVANCTDESTDTWDTIDWLVKNVPANNGRVGMWGISYPGFYAAAGMIDAHPALKCSSPQAPIADWFFDDFRHHGALFLPHAFWFLNGFGVPRPGPTSERRPSAVELTVQDGYDFFLGLGPLKNIDATLFKGRVPYWNELLAHPNYDSFWQARNLLPHLRKVAPAVLTVGGWFDAEDLYGPLKIYRAIEQLNPGIENTLVMGPWAHGGWGRGDGDRLGNVRFGAKQSLWYREQIELPFFERHLRGQSPAPQAEATIFETGANRWRAFEQWPPKEAVPHAWFVRGDQMLAQDAAPTDLEACDEFTSDPRKPVPFTEPIVNGMSRAYMTDDQRFAARRPDVLVYQTEPLAEELTLVGPLLAHLWVSTSREDADWIVKLVDVFPPAFEYPAEEGGGEGGAGEARRAAKTDPPPPPMGGYQMMVRSEVIRGRFRDSYAEPKPFAPGVPALVKLPLQDVLHTFQKGHRLMFQVQSSWFPLTDRNPQSWVDDIAQADAAAFVPATHRVWRDAAHPTRIEVATLPATPAATLPVTLPATPPAAPPQPPQKEPR
ncbi:MAG: CocE/NonD family hydrolase [Planctomycetes bacterium]|nr:CocE/NonD family hydrolase [Planctomycetota bacterium]